jgi:hypothetical protein
MRAIGLSALVFLAASGAAYAQRSPTEQYVPIGQTPAENVMQGELVLGVQPQLVQPQSASPQPASPNPATAFTMVTSGTERTYLIGPRTRIYVDRSQQGAPNELGSVADLRSGRLIEAFVPDLASRLALWVKVRP